MKKILKLLFSTDFDQFRVIFTDFVTSDVTTSPRNLAHVSARLNHLGEWTNTPTVAERSAYQVNVALTNEWLRLLVFQRMKAKVSALF